jgi:LPS sulfotransferase NodH
MDCTRFCILASPRTGSSYLVSALSSHPDIICHMEIFHPHSVQSHRALLAKLSKAEQTQLLDRTFRNTSPLLYLEEVFKQSAKLFPAAKAVGFKLFNTHNGTVWREMIESEVVKIFLYRENKLSQYASHKIATTTGKYALFEPQGAEQVKVEFDMQEFLAFIEDTSSSFDSALDYVKKVGLPHVVIEYEEISAFNFEPVLRVLGVDPTVKCRASLIKQNSRITADKFSNFDVVESTLGGTRYERWIVR